jgi:preprotein translocase subunit SecD
MATFITCGILYWFGNNFGETRIMGFALTLFIGVAVSMFTAIVVTRTFLRAFTGRRWARRLSLFMVLSDSTLPVREGS